ncbi:FAD dependent oxidoreductase family protein [Ochrobactrum quorumnocens]|uniref:FAD dependent oxidoreductase family protein n=1 Tax=Ochrobactrum quorumnocens TaxID=271865 RepID=A0A248UEZ2_9HYPH|nr:GMC family oxidoreductase N-terminal domain-containing protein [[Ochrobactrum] quorumnocens]ASV84889.1 FAD dependent oxidoreductase family protein [[Ochrobactrum] quorumnocens]
MDSQNAIRADYVVVGAGSAGAIVASRLSENPKINVVLIEAGNKDRNPWLHIPIGYSKTIGDPRYDWSYKTGPEPGLNNRMLHYARGKTLGGSSSINGLAWTLGSRHDYQRWVEAGCGDWGYEAVLPFLKRLEDFPQGGEHRGKGGPVKVEINAGRHDCIELLRESCAAYGLPEMPDPNAPEAIGVGRMQTNVHRGIRQSTSRTYLDPARARSNLEIVTGSLVQRVVLENGAAVGIEIQRDGRTETIYAEAEVILCAGAVGSPLLLEGAGIGDPERLSSLGIDIRAESREVGENARDHMLLQTKLRLRGLKSLNGTDKGVGAVWSGLQYMFGRHGPLSRTPSELIGFVRLFADEGPQDLEVYSNAMTYQFKQVRGQIKAVLDSAPGMSFNCYQSYPRSKGHVHLTATGQPSIVVNYLTDEFDRKAAVAALRLLRAINAIPPLADHVVGELAPGNDVGDSEEELLAYAAQTGATAFHLCGTCRMGSDSKSVVDEQLRVRGVRRLRVADASIMPAIIGTHTNAPAMMIGERAAAFICGTD